MNTFKTAIKSFRAYPLYYAFGAVCVVLLGVIMAYAPANNDDYHFQGEYLEMFDDLGWKDASMQSPTAIWEMLKRDYATDNARLFNLFGLAVLTLPMWVWKVIKFIGFWLFGHFMLYLAGVKRGQTQKMVWCMFLITFAIGWEYNFLCLMYFCNYVMTAALLLWMIDLFFKQRLHALSGFLLGVVLGGCHESFGLAFFGGSIVVCVFYHKYATRGYWWTLAGCVVGLLWLMLSPAWAGQHDVPKISARMLPYIAQLWFVPLWMLGWAAALCFKSTRKLAMRPLPLFCIGTLPLVAVGLLGYKLRAAMPCNYLAICANVCFFSEIIGYKIAKRSIARFATVVAALIVAFHMGAVGYTSRVADEESRELDSLCAEAQAKGIKRFYPFVKVSHPWDLPWYTLRRPYNENFRFYRAPDGARRHLYNLDKLVAVPPVLRHFSPEQAKPVPSMPGFWFMDGLLIGPAGIEDIQYWCLTRYHGFSEYGPTQAAPFVTDDGHHYTFFFVDRNLAGCFAGNPVDAKIDGLPSEFE